MTTKRDKKSNKKTDVRSSSLPPALYNLQFANCRTGMYSLRPPFKDSYSNERQQQLSTRSLTPNVVHPKYLHVDQTRQQEQPFFYQGSQKDAQVQCSLLSPSSRDGIATRRQRTYPIDQYDYRDLSPRYRVQLRLQPAQPNVYEVWDVETPPPRTIPINQPIQRREPPPIRVRSPRLVNIESISDDESDYDDDRIVYARYPRRTYLPGNVRMVCVRQDANTICY